MRSFLWFMYTLLMITFQADAQIGVRFGVNGSLPIIQEEGLQIDNRPVSGYAFGVNYLFEFSEKWSLQPELLWTQYGNKDFLIVNGQILSISTIRMNYIQAPVMARFHFLKHVFFEAGVYLGIGMGSIKENTCSAICFEESHAYGGDGYYSIKRLDLGNSIGIGLSYKKFLLGLRFSTGRRNLEVEENGDSYRNNSLLTSIAYTF